MFCLFNGTNGNLITYIPLSNIKEILIISLHHKTLSFCKINSNPKRKAVSVLFLFSRHFVFQPQDGVHFFLMLFACWEEYTTESYSHTDREHVARGKRRNQARLA